MEFKPKKKIHFYISITVSLVLLAIVIFIVDFGKVAPALLSINFQTLIIIMVLSVLHHVLMYCDRWQRMLKYLGYEYTLGEVFLVHLGTGPFHLVMPIQTGEALTAYALAKRRNNPVAVFLGTIGYGKYLNLIATLLLVLAGFLLIETSPMPGIKIGIWIFSAIVIFGLLLEIKNTREMFISLAGIFGDKASKGITQLFAVFSHISYEKKLFLLFYSLLFQFIEVLLCYMLFAAMGIIVPFPNLVAIIGIILLLTNIPITVAGAGTREALCLILLAPYADQATAVAAGVAYTSTQYLWPMIVGAPWMKKVVTDSLILKKEE